MADKGLHCSPLSRDRSLGPLSKLISLYIMPGTCWSREVIVTGNHWERARGAIGGAMGIAESGFARTWEEGVPEEG